MELQFTQFRADLYTTLHSLNDVLSVFYNGLLLYLIIFHTSKSFRSYSVILGSLTLSEFFLGLSAGLAMTRCIPIGWSLAYQFHGLCREISPQMCMNVHSITAGCACYNYSLLFVSFWYRHHVLVKSTPKAWKIGLLCFIFFIPTLISMITFASSTSDSKVTRDILYSRRNISLYPDDPKIAAIIGYESIFQKTAILLIAWILFPVFPGYCISIYYRTQILKILNENVAMSNSTKRAQRDLIKALTIQAILPIVMMSQCSMFFWRQFQLPYGEKAPYFEEAPFLLLAMVSACNPVITMYYVLPYRRRVVEMIGFWRRSSAKVQLYDVNNLSNTKDSMGEGTFHIQSMF